MAFIKNNLVSTSGGSGDSGGYTAIWGWGGQSSVLHVGGTRLNHFYNPNYLD